MSDKPYLVTLCFILVFYRGGSFNLDSGGFLGSPRLKGCCSLQIVALRVENSQNF